MLKHHSPTEPRRRGFTLLELMVSMSVLSLIMLLVFQMLSHTQRAWSGSRARLSTFKEARVAFGSITRRISQATLNTYWDYELSNTGVPLSYKKESDMHFVSGSARTLLGSAVPNNSGHAVFFQVPVGFSLLEKNQGLNGLLNDWGYYVEFADDSASLPEFLKSVVAPRSRYRLMEFRPPSEDLAVYATNRSDSGATQYSWFSDKYDGNTFSGALVSRPLAENIIMLLIEPRQSEGVGNTTTLAPDYLYDSRASDPGSDNLRHVLPPLVDVTMVAIDENSAIRYEQTTGSLDGLVPSGLFASADAYESDLAGLRVVLTGAGIDFRIFRETVVIRASKWGLEADL